MNQDWAVNNGGVAPVQTLPLATSTASNYSYLLSFSADFASGTPNPPGSGYHWSLQPSRWHMSAAFAARRAAAAEVAAAQAARASAPA